MWWLIIFPISFFAFLYIIKNAKEMKEDDDAIYIRNLSK